MTITAIHKRNVEVRILVNEHATHQHEMKKHLKTFIHDVKKRRKSADIEAKSYTVSKPKYILHQGPYIKDNSKPK